jgi:hypothetical protein
VHISWDEIARAFRDQHVPKQILIQKAQDFRTMTQGTMRVEEYELHFMRMMRYTPDDTNTEQKKQFWFLRGLHHGIRQVVTRCIAIERERLDWEDRQRNKRKFESQPRDRNASHFPPRNSFRSGFNQPNSNSGNGNSHYSRNRINGGQSQGEASYPRQ